MSKPGVQRAPLRKVKCQFHVGAYPTPIRGTECVKTFHIFPPECGVGGVCQCGEARLKASQSEKQFIKARRWHERSEQTEAAEAALLN